MLGHETARKHAALALALLALAPEGAVRDAQQEIAEAGAVDTLVGWLVDDAKPKEERTMAARALASASRCLKKDGV